MRIKLFEKFVAPFDDDKKKAAARIKGMPIPLIQTGVYTIKEWFAGGLMGTGSDELSFMFTMALHDIAKTYHTKHNGPVFRVCKINLPAKDKHTEEDVLAITHGQTGPKDVQSWSTSADGALWFYNHFAHDQNKSDVPERNRAWALIKADVNDLHQLLTFEECMQFCYDVGKKFPMADFIADRMVGDDMFKLKELICVTPDDLKFEVVEVLVMPEGSDSPKKGTSKIDRDRYHAEMRKRHMLMQAFEL